jgi:hypothetical protein
MTAWVVMWFFDFFNGPLSRSGLITLPGPRKIKTEPAVLPLAYREKGPDTGVRNPSIRFSGLTVQMKKSGHLDSAFGRLVLLMGFVALYPGFSGCSREGLDDVDRLRANVAISRGTELAQSMKYITSLERFEMAEFRNKVNSGLNRWISTLRAEDKPVDWKLSGLADTLPEGVKQHVSFTALDSERFSGNDASYVQQCYWTKNVAERVAANYTPLNHEYFVRLAVSGLDAAEKEAWKSERDLLARSVARLNPGLGFERTGDGPSAAEQLARAMELFDWTVRNVQMLDAENWPAADQMNEQALVSSAGPDSWPPSVGAKGPGYMRFPWQVFTYGKGDFIDRARMFALLCQAAEIPVVVLAIDKDAGAGRPYEEWACGVLIDKELYLFDPQLGLPIPGEKPGSIATLSQVRANPGLLAALDLTPEESVEKRSYRVGKEQLEKLVALVVAEPESLSKRMYAVNRQLAAEDRLPLACTPDAIKGRLDSCEGLKRIALWHVPFSNAQFREQLNTAFGKAEFDANVRQKLMWLPGEELYIDAFPMFRTARNLYLLGVFETDRQERSRSALSYYFRFMYSDKQIEEIEQDPQLQLSLGIRQGADQDARSFIEQLRVARDNMGRIRADAAFFMSLAHFERGNPQPALNWLNNQLPDMDAAGRWEPWREYQRGRAFEASGDYKNARDSYLRDASAQRTGSIIRARWMAELDKIAGNDSSSDP